MHWLTSMRGSNDKGRTFLLGQAGATFTESLDNVTYVTIIVMPDRHCFAAQATISTEEMDELCAAWEKHKRGIT